MTLTGQDEPFTVRLKKRQISVKVSPNDTIFNDLNILGTDYLHTYEAQLFADFDEKYFNIKLKLHQLKLHRLIQPIFNNLNDLKSLIGSPLGFGFFHNSFYPR